MMAMGRRSQRVRRRRGDHCSRSLSRCLVEEGVERKGREVS